jgi:hypothetical protein
MSEGVKSKTTWPYLNTLNILAVRGTSDLRPYLASELVISATEAGNQIKKTRPTSPSAFVSGRLRKVTGHEGLLLGLIDLF